MGRYIDDILQPGEKVLYSTNAHWIFYLPAIAAWIVAAVLLGLSRATVTDSIVLLCLSASAFIFSLLTSSILRASSHTRLMSVRMSSADWDLTPSIVGELSASVIASVHTTPFISNGVLPVLSCLLLL